MKEQHILNNIIDSIEHNYDPPYSSTAVDYYLEYLHECPICQELGSVCEECSDDITKCLYDKYRPW